MSDIQGFTSATVTGTAADITVPRPTGVNANISPVWIRLKAPTGNTDDIFVEVGGDTATAASLPIIPGEVIDEIAGSNKLSAIANSGSQTLEVTAFFD